MRLLRRAPATRSFRLGDWKLQNCATGSVPRHPRPTIHERNDRLPHFLARLEEAVVNPQLAAAVAHDHGSIRRQPHTILRAETESLETRQQFFRICRGSLIQLEHELIAITQAQHTLSV